jgi:Fe-S-cluster containining protein
MTLLDASRNATGDRGQAIAKETFQLADEIAIQYEEKTACKKTCAMCCRDLVISNHSEAQLIADFLVKTQSPQMLDGLETVLGRIKKFLAGVVAAKEDLNRAWGVSGRICPFLTFKRECMIYHVRPMSCRRIHSLDADICTQVSYARMQGQEPPHTPIIGEMLDDFYDLEDAQKVIREEDISHREQKPDNGDRLFFLMIWAELRHARKRAKR